MSSFKISRSPTPLHLPGGSVDTTAVKEEVRGRLADGSVVSGLAETLTIENTSGKILYVSFNNHDWIAVPKTTSRVFDLQCREFWLKGEGAGTTWTGIAGIRARY